MPAKHTLSHLVRFRLSPIRIIMSAALALPTYLRLLGIHDECKYLLSDSEMRIRWRGLAACLTRWKAGMKFNYVEEILTLRVLGNKQKG